MKITLFETMPDLRIGRGKKNDLLAIYREFKGSDAPCARVEWTEMDYPDADHCYKSLYATVFNQNKVSKQKIRVVKKDNEVYMIKM